MATKNLVDAVANHISLIEVVTGLTGISKILSLLFKLEVTKSYIWLSKLSNIYFLIITDQKAMLWRGNKHFTLIDTSQTLRMLSWMYPELIRGTRKSIFDYVYFF